MKLRKLKTFVSLFILFALVLRSEATTILPLTLEDQFRNSDFVAHGIVKGQNYKKLPSGDIATEIVIDLIGHSSKDGAEVITPTQYKFFVPGGVWGDIKYKVDGSPDFKEGEEVVVVLSKFKYGIKLSSLGLSKYSVKVKDDSKYLSSFLFPNHPGLSSISLASFNELLVKINNRGLEQIKDEKTVWIRPKNNEVAMDDESNRSPASLENPSNFEMVWLVLILGLLGSGSWFLAKKE